MEVISTIEKVRTAVADARQTGKTIGLVPTMGALHEGHLSLIRRCRAECDVVVVSIFVNPTQFDSGEDLQKYPRTFEDDCRFCEQEHVDLVFAPDDKQMYPEKNLTWVNVEKLTLHLCGASRPGHFRGVCTVVMKLFNIVAPDIAYFGQKDVQQLAVICRMVHDLNLPVEIRPCPTVREPDGLATSSRNRRLNVPQRKQALCLQESLDLARKLIVDGDRDSHRIIDQMKRIIERQPEAKIDYISIVDNELLHPINYISKRVLIAVAVLIGQVRLIDNIVVDPGEKPE